MKSFLNFGIITFVIVVSVCAQENFPLSNCGEVYSEFQARKNGTSYKLISNETEFFLNFTAMAPVLIASYGTNNLTSCHPQNCANVTCFNGWRFEYVPQSGGFEDGVMNAFDGIGILEINGQPLVLPSEMNCSAEVLPNQQQCEVLHILPTVTIRRIFTIVDDPIPFVSIRDIIQTTQNSVQLQIVLRGELGCDGDCEFLHLNGSGFVSSDSNQQGPSTFVVLQHPLSPIWDSIFVSGDLFSAQKSISMNTVGTVVEFRTWIGQWHHGREQELLQKAEYLASLAWFSDVTIRAKPQLMSLAVANRYVITSPSPSEVVIWDYQFGENSNSSGSSDRWFQTRNLGRFGWTVASVDKFALFVGGSQALNFDLWDSETREWYWSPLMFEHDSGAAATVGQNVLFAGGTTDNLAYIWSSSTESWRNLTTSWTAGRYHLAGVGVGSFAVFAGGSICVYATCTMTNQMHIYNFISEQWQTPALSTPRGEIPTFFALEGRYAIFARSDEYSPFIEIWDSQSVLAPAIPLQIPSSDVLSIGGAGHFIIYSGESLLRIYNIHEGSWKQVAFMNSIRWKTGTQLDGKYFADVNIGSQYSCWETYLFNFMDGYMEFNWQSVIKGYYHYCWVNSHSLEWIPISYLPLSPQVLMNKTAFWNSMSTSYTVYKFDRGISWSFASSYCASKGEKIVSITSKEENIGIFNLISGSEYWSNDAGFGFRGPWIGGFKNLSSQMWEWHSNHHEPMSVFYFSTRSYSSSAQPPNQNFVSFYSPGTNAVNRKDSRMPYWYPCTDECEHIVDSVVCESSNYQAPPCEICTCMSNFFF